MTHMLRTYRFFSLFSIMIMIRKNSAIPVKMTMRTPNTIIAIISSISSTRPEMATSLITFTAVYNYLLMLLLHMPPIPAVLDKMAVTSLTLSLLN